MHYWVYENTIHKFARIHEATCSYCSDGRGLHGGGKRRSGLWHGPFRDLVSAQAAAARTGQAKISGCNACIGDIAASLPRR